MIAYVPSQILANVLYHSVAIKRRLFMSILPWIPVVIAALEVIKDELDD